eukprot:CAMPEP_0197021206 /NCGR_PEP_ID=MMETSP1384-20130603/2112_1 /TAXON_ID=29189 /ORGANISM="Ammonia sp." /LENGTH=178 /DNA_ID=CAMNT_0042448979 /DNA_START=54 /DNA_END=587 /DNA_ORIENTATION=-
MSVINPISNQPIGTIRVKVIRTTGTDRSDANANAETAAQRTTAKLRESAQRVKAFQSRTDHRVGKRHCKQLSFRRQRQSQLKQNLKLLFNESIRHTDCCKENREFEETFSTLFTKTTANQSNHQKKNETRQQMQTFATERSGDGVKPFWERGLTCTDGNVLNERERKALFGSIRKWNM